MSDKPQLPHMIPVDSSNVEAMGHSEDGLFVQFRGSGVYRYPDVPQQDYFEGLQSDSVGTWFRESVKSRFGHEKL